MTLERSLGPAGLPIVLVPVVGFAAVAWLAGDTPMRVVLVGGHGSWLVLGASTILVLLAAIVPILVGLVGQAWGIAMVVGALRDADAGASRAIAARGFAEALRPHELGLAIAAGFLASAAGSSFVVARSRATRLGLCLASTLCFASAYGEIVFSRTIEGAGAFSAQTVTFARLAPLARDAHFLALALASACVLATLGAATLAPRAIRPDRAGLAVGGFLVLAFGASEVGLRAIHASMAPYASPSFLAHLDAFAPLELHGAPSFLPDVVVTPDALVDAHRRAAIATPEADRILADASRAAHGTRRRIAAAIDARVSPATLARVMRGMRAAGFDAVEIRGIAETGTSAAVLRSLVRDPFAGMLLPQVAATVLDLGPEDPPLPVADRRIVAASAGSMPRARRPGSTLANRSVELRLADDATASALAREVESIVDAGGVATLVDSFSSEGDSPSGRSSDGSDTIGGLLPALGEPGARHASPEGGGSPSSDALGASAAGDDVAAIRAAFARLSPEVRRCYDRALARRPGLAGRAEVAVTIGSGGRPTVVQVDPGTLGPDVGRCIERAVRDGGFPDPGARGTVSVRFPFVFVNGR